MCHHEVENVAVERKVCALRKQVVVEEENEEAFIFQVLFQRWIVNES